MNLDSNFKNVTGVSMSHALVIIEPQGSVSGLKMTLYGLLEITASYRIRLQLTIISSIY